MVIEAGTEQSAEPHCKRKLSIKFFSSPGESVLPDNRMGANCQTTGSRRLSQREAAIEVVQTIGLRQIWDVDFTTFDGMDREREMFLLRCTELDKFAKAN